MVGRRTLTKREGETWCLVACRGRKEGCGRQRALLELLRGIGEGWGLVESKRIGWCGGLDVGMGPARDETGDQENLIRTILEEVSEKKRETNIKTH